MAITIPDVKLDETDERAMRLADVPHIKTTDELVDYIAGLLGKEHDYGTAVYAMSMAATAAFYFMSGQLGVTGFQASCADLDFMRRVRRIDGPFMILQLRDAVYPQYDLIGKVREFIVESQPWLVEQAQKELAAHGDDKFISPEVRAHWQWMVSSDYSPATPGAMNALREAMVASPDYAWGWHCNIAMAAVDEGMDRDAANFAAARFMHSCFGVDTSKNDHFDAVKPA